MKNENLDGWSGALQKTMQVGDLPDHTATFAYLDRFPQHSRRLFLPEPLEDPSLLVGREKQFKLFSEALRRWQEGQPTSVALVGPQGSGKTSLINCLKDKNIGDNDVLRCNIKQRLCNQDRVLNFFQNLFQLDSPCDNVAELSDRLLNLKQRIVVLEGGHQVLLRVIGGCRAAEAFFYILLHTRRRHLWIMTCRRLPWDNMDRMLDASRYFSHLVDADCVSEENMRNALTLRLEKCGLNVAYCAAEADFKDCREKRADWEKASGDDYYRALIAASGRNFYAALCFMLLGSRCETSTSSLYLRPPAPLDLAFVKDLDHLLLLTLAEIAGHGALGIREHQQVFRTSEVQSMAALEYLLQVKLTAETTTDSNSDGQTFELSPIVHNAVTSALEQLNLIY